MPSQGFFLRRFRAGKSFIIRRTGDGLRLKGFRYYLKSIFTLFRGIKNPVALFFLGFHKSSTYAARLQLKSGEAFLVRSLMDVWILKETCLDRQYEEASLPLQDGWTVLDIGAALGDYAVWAARQLPRGRLVAAEPYPPSISLLRSNLEKNHIYNVEIFEGAVAASNGSTVLTVEEGRAVQNSTASTKNESRSIEVKTISLQALLDAYSVSTCDYLKMDCEGGEYDILFSASPETLKRVERICMEVHDGMTVHNRQEMIAFLEKNGYKTRLTPNPVHCDLAYLYADKTP